MWYNAIIDTTAAAGPTNVITFPKKDITYGSIIGIPTRTELNAPPATIHTKAAIKKFVVSFFAMFRKPTTRPKNPSNHTAQETSKNTNTNEATNAA